MGVPFQTGAPTVTSHPGRKTKEINLRPTYPPAEN